MSPNENADSAAWRELEAVRAEAAALRRQLAESPDRGRELESRIDSLAARNAKLMETLKEARQQLLALREEVDRLGQPPSGYGVLLGVHEDDTVDVFTSGRKMRLTCSPNIDAKSLKQGQTVRLNEALTVVEAGNFEAVGEICTLREILADGHRALVVGHADEERIVWLAEPLVPPRTCPTIDDDRRRRRRPAAAQAAPRRLAAGRHQGRLRVRAHPQGRGRGSGARRGARRQLQRHRRPGPADRADPRRRRAAVPAQGALPRVLAAPAQGRAAVRPARLRQDADRQGRGQLAGQEDGRGPRRRRPRGEVVLPQHQGPRAAEQVRRRDRAAHPADLPAGPREGVRGHPGDRVLRRDGLDLPHPRHRRAAPTSRPRSCRSCFRRSTVSRAWRTSS